MNTSVIPKGFRAKRVGPPEKGELILGKGGEVLRCSGALSATCAIVEPIGGVGYEPSRNVGRRRTDAPQDKELEVEG